MIDRHAIFAAGGCLVLTLGSSAHAASAITAAAIATGRLYVVGTTDQPHASVTLDGKFTAESDDKGKFQFELVYYPIGCVVRATIGGKTTVAKVEQCGEICQPALQAGVQPAPKRGSGEPLPAQPPAAPPAPIHPHGMALVVPQTPQTTNALTPSQPVSPQPEAEKAPEPILHPPLPPRRPTDLMRVAVKRLAPEPIAHPSAPHDEPRVAPSPRPAQQEVPDDRPTPEAPDAPERSDIY